MLFSYLKICLKVLVRRKFFTVISLFGVCFTLTVLMVVAAMLDHLLAPGTPEVEGDRTIHVSRLAAHADNGEHQWVYSTRPGYAFLDRHAREIPGVELMSIFSTTSSAAGFVDNRKVVSRLRHTDADYWRILRFDFIVGAPFDAEDDAKGNKVIVISERTRREFFGDDAALGKTITLSQIGYRIVGVVANVPLTRFTAAADAWAPHGAARSQEFRSEMRSSFWRGTAFEGMFLAESKSNIPRIKREFRERLGLMELPEGLKRVVGEPMTRLEFCSMVDGVDDEGNPKAALMLLPIIGLLIAFMLLPTMNLININLSRFMERTSEIGVRKAFGASSAQLAWQFVVENIILCLIGGVLALIAAYGCLRIIEGSGLLAHAELEFNYRVFAYSLALAIFFGLLSGAYPAWRTSRLHPVDALRGGVR